MKRSIESIREWQQRSNATAAENRRTKPRKPFTRIGLEPALRRKAVRRVSKRRTQQNADYKTVAANYLVRHPVCHHCIESGRGVPKPATEIHHVAGRAGGLLTFAPLFMAVASECHTVAAGSIHVEVKLSREAGWLISRNVSLDEKLRRVQELRGHWPHVEAELKR